VVYNTVVYPGCVYSLVYPGCVYSLVYPGVYARVHTLVYMPVYTTLGTPCPPPASSTRVPPRDRRDRLTALRREVTETNISDEPLTVAQRVIPLSLPVSLLVSS